MKNSNVFFKKCAVWYNGSNSRVKAIISTVIVLAFLNIWVWCDYNSFQNSAVTLTMLFTAFAALATGFAAYATQKSSKIAEASVSQSAIENKRIAFENTFHLLLTQHNEKLREIKLLLKDGIPLSDSELSKIGSERKESLDPKQNFLQINLESKSIYDACALVRVSEALSPYFILLFQILKFIDLKFYLNDSSYKNSQSSGVNNDYSISKIIENDVHYQEKKFYTSLIRAFISSDILFLIAVNCAMIIPFGEKQQESKQYFLYRRFLRKYHFFEHLRIDDLHIRKLDNCWLSGFYINFYGLKKNKLKYLESTGATYKLTLEGKARAINEQVNHIDDVMKSSDGPDFFYEKLDVKAAIGFIYYGYGSARFTNKINRYVPYSFDNDVETATTNLIIDEVWGSDKMKCKLEDLIFKIQGGVDRERY